MSLDATPDPHSQPKRRNDDRPSENSLRPIPPGACRCDAVRLPTTKLTGARPSRVRVQRFVGPARIIPRLGPFLSIPLSRQWLQLQDADIAVVIVGD